MPAEDVLESVVVRMLALRDIMTVVLANQALATQNPDKLFKRLSEGLSEKIDESGGAPEFVEKIRAEIDWIVSAAQTLARKRKS